MSEVMMDETRVRLQIFAAHAGHENQNTHRAEVTGRNGTPTTRVSKARPSAAMSSYGSPSELKLGLSLLRSA